jgi:hypothetical protein
MPDAATSQADDQRPAHPSGDTAAGEMRSYQRPDPVTARQRAVQRQLDAAEAKQRALELRQRGFSYRQIAQAIGYRNASTAWRCVMAAIHERYAEPAEEVTKLELAKLDSIEAEAWQAWEKSTSDAQRHTTKEGKDGTETTHTVETRCGDAGYLNVLVRVAERRSALCGLDAPKKIGATVAQGMVVVQAPFDVAAVVGKVAMDSQPPLLTTGQPNEIQGGQTR